jgi:hypothetical protein
VVVDEDDEEKEDAFDVAEFLVLHFSKYSAPNMDSMNSRIYDFTNVQ